MITMTKLSTKVLGLVFAAIPWRLNITRYLLTDHHLVLSMFIVAIRGKRFNIMSIGIWNYKLSSKSLIDHNCSITKEGTFKGWM